MALARASRGLRRFRRRERQFVQFLRFRWAQTGEPRQRDAMNASDPTRQMALVGKAGVGSDFGQARPPFPNKLDRTLQSEMHDIAMRCYADRSAIVYLTE